MKPTHPGVMNVTEVLLHEAMLRYRCNLQGCCCREWRISFDGEDLVRLLQAHTPDERDTFIDALHVTVNEEHVIQEVSLQSQDEARVCTFLAQDGGCGLQRAKGVEVLPKLCREFPVHAQRLGDRLELHYDAVCPEVLRRLDEEPGPFELALVEPPPDSEMAFRTRRVFQVPPVHLGDFLLEWDDVDHLRRRALHAFNTRQEPALHTLARLNYALARLAQATEPIRFEPRDDDPVEPFERYLDRCVPLHDSYLLARTCAAYARFVFDVELHQPDWAALTDHLRDAAAWRQTFEPHAQHLDPLLRAYLCHRFHSTFDRSPVTQQLSFTWGTINHSVATALRIATALARWLQRPLDRPLLKMGIGAAEYLYRSIIVPADAMPWFHPELESTP